jgi:integrase/recombinase XerD
MNHRPQVLNFSSALNGFLQYKLAEGLSPATVFNYERDLKLWLAHMGDQDIGKITSANLLEFLNYLRSEYVPRRIAGKEERKLSDKTIYNFYVSLSAFFTWAGMEFEMANPMKKVPRPRVAEGAPVEPFRREEIELLIKACDACAEADTHDRRRFIMARPTGKRDKAILLTLLDTGLRASELCALRIGDVDMKTGKVTIRPGVEGKAKGRKGRTVYLGKSARRFLWRYLTEREDETDPDEPLFVGKYNRPMNRDGLRQLLGSLGEKVQVLKCHPHRFRHTFAITYLRSGGDLFTLKSLLGHSTLEMVEHYARIADVDVEQAHRKASPADNWRL